MGIDVQPFKIEDVMGIDLGERATADGDREKIALYHIEHSLGSATYRVDGQIVAMIGLDRLDEHTGEPWVVLTPAFKKHMVSVTKAIKRDTMNLLKSLGNFTIVTSIAEDDIQAIRFAETIGFSFPEEAA
jgi:hypothetical protein